MSDKTPAQIIGQRIREIRLAKGYTSYKTFALEHDIEPRQYFRYEAGEANFKIETLIRLAKCFEMSVQELLDGLDLS